MKFAFLYWCVSIGVLVSGRGQLSKSKMDKIDYDLHQYLRSLNKIADFFLARKYYVDIIIDFGVFLENVNLKRVLRDKGERLPVALRVALEKLVRKNYELIEYFNGMLEQDPNPESEPYRNLSTLLNEDVWLDRIENFHDVLGKKREPFLFYDQKYLRNHYLTWDKYVTDISLKNGTPLPEESDYCLLSVSTNPINYSQDEKECDIPIFCRYFIPRGTDFGYHLTHRLLIIFVANYARGCYVISPKADKRFKKKFCADIYSESSFIEMNSYKALDLFSEQLFFCALDGHSEFIKRHWFTEMLSLQTKEGCFPESRNHSEALRLGAKRKRSKHYKTGWVLNNAKRDNTGRFLMLGGRCNGHTTALVGGALSSAVRFLMEKFY